MGLFIEQKMAGNIQSDWGSLAGEVSATGSFQNHTSVALHSMICDCYTEMVAGCENLISIIIA